MGAIDSSKHTVQSVTVEPGVKLEVLDWGGKDAVERLEIGTGLQDDGLCNFPHSPAYIRRPGRLRFNSIVISFHARIVT
jgi:hypothetical protein